MSEVDPDLLRVDADRYWQRWSLEFTDWSARLRKISYTRADFSAAPGSDEVREAFGASLRTLEGYFHTGEEILEGFARALLQTAIEYMRAEDYAEAEIRAVVRRLKGL